MSYRSDHHQGHLSCTVISTIIVAFLALSSLLSSPTFAETATEAEMETVCRNWLATIVHEQGNWAGEVRPVIEDVQEIVVEGTVLARCYSIAPQGHVVVPVLKDLPPIKVSSEVCRLDVEQAVGAPLLLREMLANRAQLFIQAYGSLDAVQPPQGVRLFGLAHRELWDRYLVDPPHFAVELGQDGAGLRTEVGPLLTTSWHQGAPYNDYAPDGDGGQCVVGCVATAASQVMRYHQWPPRGMGAWSYIWDGDQSCGGNVGGGWQTADFTDEYDWANMPNNCGGGCTPDQVDALAELCYEVGVAFEMDFGRCGSGAYTSDAIEIFPAFFRYDPSIDEERRSSHSAASWFDLIQEEIDGGRPMLYSFRYSSTEGHAIVCDGWRDTGGEDQYHMNYGWGGSYNAWYAIDDIYHDYNPGEDRIIRRIMPGTGFVFQIRPDGLGYYPTIQEAIDEVFEGDIVELTDGTFTGVGNRDIDFHGKSVTVRSESGDPATCIIDCEGNPEERRGFSFVSGEDANSILQGITIANGFVSGRGEGGAVLCTNGSSPTIRNCRFEGNVAADAGGNANGAGIASIDASPTVIDCFFSQNEAVYASNGGGGIYASGGFPSISGTVFSLNVAGGGGGGALITGAATAVLTNCTFYGNSAGEGGGLWTSSDSSIQIDNSIFAFGTGGGGVICDGGSGSVVLSCSDIYGNSGGDWQGCISGQLGSNGNISEDPLFCDQENENYHLQAESPCGPENNPSCGLIGALPLGCGQFLVTPDGSGDFPTIQAAIDYAVDGDLIELTNGTFTGDGNRDLDFGGRSITLRSQSGDPDSCIIDCEGTEQDQHRGFRFRSGESPLAIVQGITVTGGLLTTYSGGAAWCSDGSSPTFIDCIFCNNRSNSSGGAFYCSSESNPTFDHCTFYGNRAGNGGGIFVYASQPTITNCTFGHNTGDIFGGGICSNAPDFIVENTIIAFSTNGGGVFCYGTALTLECCDVYENVGGDWTGCLDGQEGVNGNICEDPLFCNPPNGDYRLADSSPCAAQTPPNEECDLIGAWAPDCDVADVDDTVISARVLTLHPAVPNPFGQSTTMSYVIPSSITTTAVRLSIFDPSGRLVRTLIDAQRPTGIHEVRWDGRNQIGSPVAAGIYFYQLQVNGQKLTKQMVLIR